jgi:stage II sporulation protein D
MVVSAARLELSDISSAAEPVKSSLPDQSELAAALSAVLAYIDLEQQAQSSSDPLSTAHSGWAQASLREAVGGTGVRAPQPQCKLSAWQTSLLFKSLSLLLICSSLFSVLPAAKADPSSKPSSRPSSKPALEPASELASELASESASALSAADSDKNLQSAVDKSGGSVLLRPPLPLTSSSAAPTSAQARESAAVRKKPYALVTPAKGYPFYTGPYNGTGRGTLSNARRLFPASQAAAAAPAAPAVDGTANTNSAGSARSPITYSDTTYDTATPISGSQNLSYQRAPVLSDTSANTAVENSLSSSSAESSNNAQAFEVRAAALPAVPPQQPVQQPAQSTTPADPELTALLKAAGQINPGLMPHDCIRVGLYFGTDRTELAAIDGAQIRDASTGALVARLSGGSRWQVAVQSSLQGAQLTLLHKPGPDSFGKQTDGADPLPNTAYGERGHIRTVAYFPGATALPSVSAMRFPFKVGANLLRTGSQGEWRESGSGYVILPKQDQVLAINGRLYRGAIWLKPAPRLVNPNWKSTGSRPQYRASSFDVINLVNLEDYLLSVVPSEMPSSWPLEALKAQAIAARSYAVSNQGKHSSAGYDLKATIDDQVYSGISSENENSNRAVAETAGLVLKHQGKAVTAFFHSTSGGSTELAEQVWGRPLPYLQSVPDFDDASPHFSWTKRLRVDDLEQVIGHDIGRLLSLSVVSRSSSNRAQLLLAQGSAGSKLLTGESMRKLFKLPSTMFNIGSEESVYIFAGRGFGHGLGMSQYGAKALAERGYNAAQILSYYYKDVIVDYVAIAPGI